MVGPAISPASMGCPSSAVTMPTMSGSMRCNASCSGSMPCSMALAAVMTVNNAVLMRYVAAVGEEFPRVLEVIAINDLAEDAFGGDRRADRRKHQRDLALRHDGDRLFDDAILPTPVTE